VVDADEILVLDRGGSSSAAPTRLLARGGLYAALWRRQHHEAIEPAAE
jgi:ABC-type multidrug transport system fused ATPase/permease subunit